jgi:hypothetical protein
MVKRWAALAAHFFWALPAFALDPHFASILPHCGDVYLKSRSVVLIQSAELHEAALLGIGKALPEDRAKRGRGGQYAAAGRRFVEQQAEPDLGEHLRGREVARVSGAANFDERGLRSVLS